MTNQLAIGVLVRQWQLVDGTLDNAASTAAVRGENLTATTADRVRRAGWDAAESAGGPKHLGWPAVDQRLTVTLDRDDWTFVVEQLNAWDAVGEQTSETVHKSRELQDIILKSLNP